MKFREKTYLTTLLLFLLLLNACIFSLAYYTQHKSSLAAKELCLSEASMISSTFENNISRLNENGKRQVMSSFVDYYGQKDIGLLFADENENVIVSSIPDGAQIPKPNLLSTQRTNGKRYILISVLTADGQYTMTYSKDVSFLDEDFKSISTVFVITSVGASLVLALVLFLILRRLSDPLEKLKQATEEIASGNFSARADDSGKDEFSLLASDFNRMAEHIETQMDELTENAKTKQIMLDNLAHEMRTPLTSIRGYAEYLLNANIGEDEKTEAIEYIISESEHLKRIGDRLLDEAFIRENGIKAENADIGLVISDSAKALGHYAAQRGVELKIRSVSFCLYCDAALIEILVTNLIKNAINACKNGGTVMIGCEVQEDKLLISVCDNGIGMTSEQICRIKEPFYRTDRSRSRKDGGTGLGLSLCDRIAKAHNAELLFESELSKGTVATVVFNFTKP